MADWRFDDSDEADFDAGFEKFVKDRNIKTYKKGDPVPKPGETNGLYRNKLENQPEME